MRRQRKRERIDYSVHDDGACFVRKRFGNSIANVAGLFDADSFRTHGLGNFGEIGILECNSEGDYAGLLLLDIHEVERPIIEDDLNHWGLSFHLRQ